jgi:hypothetical protein
MYREHPERWIKVGGRSRPGEEGWTEPVPDPPQSSEAAPPPWATVHQEATDEQALGVIQILLDAGVLRAPGCSLDQCPCPRHRVSGATEDEPSEHERRSR